MNRKITCAVLVSLGLGLFWQALAQSVDCQTLCREKYVQCRAAADKSNDPVRGLKICNDAYHSCVGNCVNTRNPLKKIASRGGFPKVINFARDISNAEYRDVLAAAFAVRPPCYELLSLSA